MENMKAISKKYALEIVSINVFITKDNVKLKRCRKNRHIILLFIIILSLTKQLRFQNAEMIEPLLCLCLKKFEDSKKRSPKQWKFFH